MRLSTIQPLIFQQTPIPPQVSLKDGFQSTKKEALAKVVKKKPNVLDSRPSHSSSSGSKKGSAKDSPPASPLPPAGMTEQQQTKMDELIGEVNKLKAIVLKHEVRIRDLEKRVDTVVPPVTPTGDEAAAATKNGGA